MTWEHFQHSADVGIRGIGPTVAAAFAEAGCALTAVMTDPDTVRPHIRVPVVCQADDPEGLFYAWISTLIYEMDVQKMLFGRFDIRIDDLKLTGDAWGEPIDPTRHDIAVGVKAATFMALNVRQTDTGQWAVQCVVDV